MPIVCKPIEELPCGQEEVMNCGYSLGNLGNLLLWFIIITVIVWFIIWAIKPTYFQKMHHNGERSGQIDSGKVLIGAMIIALIIIVIIYVLKMAMRW